MPAVLNLQSERGAQTPANAAFVEYFKCPDELVSFEAAERAGEDGFFRFGEAACFGSLAGTLPARRITQRPPDVSGDARCEGGRLVLPFDLAEVLTNLREERYQRANTHPSGLLMTAPWLRALYYSIRPVLSIGLRKHVQRVGVGDWNRISFPRWPVDDSVETLMGEMMKLALKASNKQRLPFVWFWPDGATACAMMTHDVEGVAGRDFCPALMEIDRSFDVPSAFQIVPEPRSLPAEALFDLVRRMGFEANVHDLNHDGFLFHSRTEFLRRAALINEYARRFDCLGFRSGSMYRQQEWFDAFDFSFDMSVPNVAHLEPQRGGCCTVLPYFIGRILELPLTTIQDYSLFHILGDYSTRIWVDQIGRILERHGLISFITHPDYLAEARARSVYMNLLDHLFELRKAHNIWFAPPGHVNTWWRDRRDMTLVRDGSSWRIAGHASSRARLAWAVLDGDRVAFEVEGTPPAQRVQ